MSARCPLHCFLTTATACLLAGVAALATATLGSPRASAATVTTAWQNGALAPVCGKGRAI